MFYVIISLALAVGAALFALYIRRNPYGELPERKGGKCAGGCGSCGGCAGRAAERREKPEYFDDEELDAFAGVKSGEYGEEQAALFRSVFEGLRPGEAAAWAESLRRRGIEIPSSLKGEAGLKAGGG